jgi:hypothetical protein
MIMNTIKSIAVTALVTIGSFTAVTYTACNKDKCKDVVCQNGGTCSEGNCNCLAGFEGDRCQTKVVDKFVGTWNAAETCGSVPSPAYQVTITGSGTSLVISNLGNYGCSLGGNITWAGSITNSTSVTINDNKCSYQMNGTGTYNTNGSVTFTYTTTYTLGGVPQTDNCTVTLTK